MSAIALVGLVSVALNQDQLKKLLLPLDAFSAGSLLGGALLHLLSEAVAANGPGLHYAEIRADLKRRGALIGANDLFIAAHARALGLTLVTNNTAEFERVRDLKLNSWTTPTRRGR